MTTDSPSRTIPFFGARKMARTLLTEIEELTTQRDLLRQQLANLGALSVLELDAKKSELELQIEEQTLRLQRDKAEAAEAVRIANERLAEVRRSIVATEDVALLQEVGIYRYRHPLTDAVAYENELAKIEEAIKGMIRKDGGAVLASQN